MTFAEYQANAPLHINSYLKAGIESIDEQLGRGYAAANPELLGAYIRACVADVASNVLQDDVAGRLDDIGVAVGGLGNAIGSRP